MNDHEDPPGDEDAGSGETIDTGEPIAELARLREEPTSGFLQRIRRSIHRRLSIAEALDFSLMALFQTFFEYVTLIVKTLGSLNKPEGRGK